ncbi:class I SAM-dependent methyltransferase [Pseudonocardia sp. TRM90224]|uniref:class I SAM-dependent methyltransferase n=1 Tax=Pseudonocardia sp. TRM90224 TaxID=2812678 RepID=UPI001E52EAAC|nr:class I SAM-dependent methyltransferase [Pseudonocardia sp. TRM90224]
MGREKITLSGPQETMLATLYGRAIDNRSAQPILRDRAAEQALELIDYDFRKTGMTPMSAAGIALRARQLDRWTAEFVTANPEATVLHLACGLDTRAQRLAVPPTVLWVDVDHPEVVELRERLLTPPSGDYRMVGASVLEDGWLDEVPADRPTVAVFEGLTMYLRQEDGKRLVQRICERFPSGRLLFDAYGPMGIRMQKLVPAVRNSGSTLHWGVADPRELEAWHPGLTCLDALRSVDMPGISLMRPSGRAAMWVMAHLPGFRDVGWILRYRF